MPVIVIGADTPLGPASRGTVADATAEVRAFVTDPEHGMSPLPEGIKVAVGDVSDGSHVGGAAYGCFSAVLLTEAATDDRERSFAGRARTSARRLGRRRCRGRGDQGDLGRRLSRPRSATAETVAGGGRWPIRRRDRGRHRRPSTIVRLSDA